MYQQDIIDFTILTPMISLFILLILVVMMIYFYAKMRVPVIILVIFLFSLVMGMISIQNVVLPFTPYFQICFMLIQTIFFLLTVLEVIRK